VNEVENPDIKLVMDFMARDEARHAGFINKALRDYGKQVNLNFLREKKAYKYFKPKYIFYATYLSEKIGYARYITIFRQFEKHPELRFHPMFRWFEDWCNDEFRHGEVFALIMKSQPELLTGVNKYWIRFFLLAVFATMYVRDHTRPLMHEAMGYTPSDYDFEVFHITSEISKQIFPLTLDIDNPKFKKGLDKLLDLQMRVDKAKAQGGLLGLVKRGGLSVAAATTFLGLYLLPVKDNELPDDVRMVPSW
jgi:magnesium-protoporphyrin IX monomethyl ester (oxidative) cyclase